MSDKKTKQRLSALASGTHLFSPWYYSTKETSPFRLLGGTSPTTQTLFSAALLSLSVFITRIPHPDQDFTEEGRSICPARPRERWAFTEKRRYSYAAHVHGILA